MKNKNSKETSKKIKLILFLFCYVILIFHNMFRMIDFLGAGIFGRQVYHLALFILGILSINSVLSLNKKKIALIFLTTLAITISSIIAKDLFLIVIWLTILAAKGIDINKLIKYDLLIKLIGMFTVVTFYSLGLTNSEVYYRDEEIRQTLGFNNPNTLSNYVLSVYLDILFISRNRKMTLSKILVTIAAILFIYFIAGSRTQVVGVAVAFILFTNKKIFKKKRKKTIIASSMFFVLAIFSFIMTVAYLNNPIGLDGVNELLSGRLGLSARAYRNYGINFIGNQNFTKDMLSYPLDNVYMNILIIHGLLTLIAIGIFIGKFISYLVKNNKNKELAALITFIMLGMSETAVLKPYYNPYLISSSNMLFNNEEPSDEKEKQ